MDPTSPLTLLGLLIAVFAILPPHRRLDLRVRFSRFDWFVFWFALGLLHYIVFYPVIDRLGFAAPLGPWRWGFQPETASYAVVLGATAFLWVRASLAQLRSRTLPMFDQLSGRLLFQGAYSDLLPLLERHLKRLVRFQLRGGRLARLHERIALRGPIHIDADEIGSGRRSWLPAGVSSALSHVLPDGEHEAELANGVLRRLLLSESFVKHQAAARPFFGTEVLDSGIRNPWDFLEIYMESLLEDPTSVLYFEIRENQNLRGAGRRFELNPSNRLICYFLEDPRVAKELRVYKPLGDYALAYLDRRRRLDRDSYNEPLDLYHEVGRWKCPIHTVVKFFHIMIPEALHRGITWHMWVFYMPYIVERILKNLSPTPAVDLTREWPTPYHCLLYEITSAVCSWIECTTEVPEDQENVVMDNEEATHNNENIPKSCILVLGDIMRYVVESDRLDPGFKTYLFESTLYTVRALERAEGHDGLRRVLVKSLAKGGFRTGEGRLYQENLLNLWATVDFGLAYDCRDVNEAVLAELGE